MTIPQEAKKIVLTFSYEEKDEKQKPSTLKAGGPYDIGRVNIVAVVAENGDDVDFNDAVAQFVIR